MFVLNNKNNKNNDENSRQLLLLEKQKSELDYQISTLTNSIKQAQQNLESYENIPNNNDIYFDAKEQVGEISLQIKRLLISQENAQNELDRLIDEEDNLKSEINSLENSEKEILRKLEILNKTKEYLSQAHQNVSMRFVEPVNNAMKEIVQTFDLKGREFVIDTNFDIKQITDKGVKELDYSSQGIKDILTLCMRIYLISVIYKHEKPVIILDDTFVNLDDENMKKAGEILKTLAGEYQIIYSFCHKRCEIKNSKL